MHHAIVHSQHKKHVYIRVPASVVKKHDVLKNSFPHAVGNIVLPVKLKKCHHHLKPGHKVQFQITERNVKHIAFVIYIMPVIMCMLGIVIGLAIQARGEITLVLGILLYWIGIMITRIMHKNHALYRHFDVNIS